MGSREMWAGWGRQNMGDDNLIVTVIPAANDLTELGDETQKEAKGGVAALDCRRAANRRD